MNSHDNGLEPILTQALDKMKEEQGDSFDLDKVNLAELERRTGISRAKLRRLKRNHFSFLPNGHQGRKAKVTVLTGYTNFIDEQLRKGIINSSVIFSLLQANGYNGGQTQVKEYIRQHKYLVPKRRKGIIPLTGRTRRYYTQPGESFQMDWGFVNVQAQDGKQYRIACFVMVCHYCRELYVEFFPNARQESLFIGMLHAFARMGVPQYVLTDNMKSVVIRRDTQGKPIWQKDYEVFMNTVGFDTKLCKPGHPYTKGTVERMVRFVKQNFLATCVFTNITELNYQAETWTGRKNKLQGSREGSTAEEVHLRECGRFTKPLDNDPELLFYLAPERAISFDGFVNYEGRRFGVPASYYERTCRVMRDGYVLHIYDVRMTQEIVRYNVTWGKWDSVCEDQFRIPHPEEEPTVPPNIQLVQKPKPPHDPWFEQFRSEGGFWNE